MGGLHGGEPNEVHTLSPQNQGSGWAACMTGVQLAHSQETSQARTLLLHNQESVKLGISSLRGPSPQSQRPWQSRRITYEYIFSKRHQVKLFQSMVLAHSEIKRRESAGH